MSQASRTTTAKSPPMAAGQKYGLLTAVEFVDRNRNYTARWRFRCDCGGETIAPSPDVRRGNTRSCGCRVGKKTHGLSLTPEYGAWSQARSRCNNQDHVQYPDYGGRGIKVCNRWNSFENFLIDMGKRPSPRHSLDRFPNNGGNYEPGNCRWATSKEQCRNKRDNRLIEFRGHRMTVSAAAELMGLPAKTVRVRLNRRGWTVERALTQPI